MSFQNITYVSRQRWPIACLALLLAGCGGGGGSTAPDAKTVRPTLELAWLERSRSFEGPSSALSATITYIRSRPNGEDLTFTVDRPTAPAATTQTYTAPVGIEPGPTTVRVTFHAGAGGQGALVGTAQTPATVGESGGLTDAQGAPLGRIVTAGTITKVVIPPNQFVRVAETKAFAFSAQDGQGYIVALSPGSFKIQAGAGVEVNTEGTMTGKAVGTPQVTVTVDGKSATESVMVEAANSEAVRVFSVRGNHLVYSPLTHRIYAGVSATDPKYGNRMVTLDPNRPGIEASAEIGQEPAAMAIGADGRTIHVSLDKEFAIRQFDAQSGVAGLKFNPSAGTVPVRAEDITAHPTLPGTIVASLAAVDRYPRHMDVAVFDNGVARTKRVAMANAGTHHPTNRVEWSEREGVVYGLNSESSEFGIRTLAVDGNGIIKTQDLGKYFDHFYGDIAYRSGRIYGSNGLILDPADPSSSTRLWSERVSRPFVVDATARRYYAVKSESGNMTLDVYDLDNGTLVDSKMISKADYAPKEVILIGPGRLAMTTTTGPILVLDLAKLPGLGG